MKTAFAAATCLPAALASVLLGLPAGLSAAETEPDVHSQIESASRASRVILELVDGQTISGRFYGFVGDWRDTVAAAVRYEAWRNAQAGGLPRLGEPMVVFLASGDTLRGSFKGVGPTYLVLSSSNSRFDITAVVAAIADAKSDTGSLAPWSELRGRLLDAPSVIGVGLKRGTETVIVSREAILSARGEGSREGPGAALMIVGIVASVAFCVIVVSSVNDASNKGSVDCSNSLDSFVSFCQAHPFDIDSADERFGDGDLTNGPAAWAPGETRRP